MCYPFTVFKTKEQDNITLHTDAGVRAGLPAAGACIIRRGNTRYKLAFLLETRSPFLAELQAGLVGIYSISALQKSSCNIDWYSDCKTLLEIAEVPARRAKHDQFKLYWDAYSEAVGDKQVSTNHAPAKGEILRCDKACRWLQQKGEKLIARYGEGPVGTVTRTDPKAAWRVVDLREIQFSKASIGEKLAPHLAH